MSQLSKRSFAICRPNNMTESKPTYITPSQVFWSLAAKVGAAGDPLPLWMRRMNRAIAILEAIAADPDTPPTSSRWAKECIVAIKVP